ncbi:MAG: hypothetical protein M0Q51_11775 [Bacteroidales bacterium]|nr:hypothetical protein [Bacteroidales bacterium]
MAKTILNSEFSPEIRRARIDHLNIYEISEGELETLKKGSPGSIFLNFAIFLIGSALTLIVAILTTNVKSNLTFIIFVILSILGFLAGILLLFLWHRNNKSITQLVDIIRKRLPREEIPEI